MSNRRTARSNANNALTKPEIRQYESLLKSRGAVLLKHPAVVRSVLKSPRKIEQALGSLIPSKDPHAQARKQWEVFYKKYFNIAVDLSKVVIPAQPDGFTRLIIVAHGIVSLNVVMQVCKKYFPTWQYVEDLDKSVTKNDRTAATGAYAVWFRDRIEADEEMANKSANDLDVQNIKGITLLERLLLELEYFGRTDQHLDINNWTLCAGSRGSDGYVPCVGWSVGGLDVYWTNAGPANPFLRVRPAVY